MTPLAATVLPESEQVPSVLDPAGPAAAELAALSHLLLWSAAGASALTFLLLALALRRRTRARPGTGFVVLLGIALPAVALGALLGVALDAGRAVTRPPSEPGVVVEVIGHQFWWEVRYPDADVVTANEIVIPVDRPVEVRLRSDDVIHSFWVPQLQGKTDLVPGRENGLWLEADEPGVYRGVCAEFCGIQHAKMHKLVIAVEAEAFDAWLARQAQGASAPSSPSAERGEAIFGASCMQCHAVRGRGGPDEVVAPDLTHLASRRTIAAGILPNNRGSLGGWILDPHSSKPGVRMPPTNLAGPQLQDLLDYLEGLR